MNKYAYRLADFAKGIKAVRAKGLVHRRNLVPDVQGDKMHLHMSKHEASGPMAMVIHGKHLPSETQGYKIDLKTHKNGIYSRGNGHNILSDIHKHVHDEHGITRKNMSGGDRKAVNHVVMRHEMDEMRAFKELRRHHKDNLGSSLTGTGHQAPSVLLRESNNVAKLGAGTRGKELYHKAKGLMVGVRRATGEADHLNHMIGSMQAPKSKNVVFKNHKPSHAPMNYEYGKTRLSRHAIRAMDKGSLRQGHTVITPKD